MTQEQFLESISVILDNQEKLYKLDEILDTNVSCDTFLSNLVDDHAELLLNVVSDFKTLPDRIIDYYWDTIANGSSDDVDQLIDLYEIIQTSTM